MNKEQLLASIRANYNEAPESSSKDPQNPSSSQVGLSSNSSILGLSSNFNFNTIEYDSCDGTKVSYLENLEKYRIYQGDEHVTEDVALQIKSFETGDLSILGTNGNFSMVKGKQKSRKSFFINLTIASVFSHDDQGNLRSSLKEGKDRVLYIDTEQSKNHVIQATKRIWEQSHTCHEDKLHTYALRSMSVSERLYNIEGLINESKDIGLVVIDGIRDLVTSVNDEGEASLIASKLLKWTEELNIHIIVVLHENPSSEKARGHLGTELTNKAETVIGIEVDKQNPEISIIKPFSCRNKPFDSFAISVDDNGIPFIVEGHTINAKSSAKVALNDLEDDRKFQIVKMAFNQQDLFGYKELVNKIKELLNEKGFKKIKNTGDNYVKKLITYAKDKTWITQEGKSKPYKLNHQFTYS